MGLFQLIKGRHKNKNNTDGAWKYCPFCGKEIQKEWKVCPFCGNALSNTTILEQNSKSMFTTPKVVSVDQKENVEVTQKKLPDTAIDGKETSRAAENETVKTEYEFWVEVPKGVALPEELVDKLPAPGRIAIISFSNGDTKVGTRYYMFRYSHEKSETFIQYEGISTPNLPYSEKRTEKIQLFADSYHPFFSRYTNDIRGCFEAMLGHESELPSNYEVSDGTLCVKLDSGYHDSSYKETQNYFCYRNSYSESYHDGGGSGSIEWYIYAASGIECKTELTEEIGYKKFSDLPGFIELPYCRGFWTENGHVYLVDPWGFSGVFEYYCHAEKKRDYDSKNEIWDIGVSCEK